MTNSLDVKNLTKTYGSLCAVDDLSIEVHKGETFGLLGHNGAGKSTTIECILGVKTPDRGQIEVLGMNTTSNRKEVFERVGVQFQETNYHEKIKVVEICKLTESFYKTHTDLATLLNTFGLTGKENSLVSELSGGERQRLSVILALIPNPKMVFLDELTSGLDTKARWDVWKHLECLKKRGLTVLLTSHFMDEVEALCDRVCILKKGKAVICSDVDDVISQSPHDTLEEAYLWYAGEEETDEIT